MRLDNPSKKTSLPRPWLDCEGNVLPDVTLQETSKSWDADTWERFLNSTVDQELHRRETTVATYDDLFEDNLETLWGGFCPLPESVQRQTHLAIRSLTPVQRAVIRGLYFFGLSQAKLAQRLKVAQQTVSESKIISLKKIKSLLEVDPIVATYLIGGSANLKPFERSRDEQTREVYIRDLKGSYLK